VSAEARGAFVRRFGHVAEGSPWVAEMAWREAPFVDRASLVEALARAVRAAPADRQLTLVRAHPDLAGRAALAGEITPESAAEQASAGLDRLTPADMERIAGLNRAYSERFGFPFVICVRGRSVAETLAALERRLANDAETERLQAVEEIVAIIALRVDEAW
jgi:2-oxo-4-hydroxy-4-carboxy-5-ureidoimidazoline decarboxylase